LTVTEAEREVRVIEAGMTFMPDSEAVYREWRRIVVQYGISGGSGTRRTASGEHVRSQAEAHSHIKRDRLQPLQRSGSSSPD